MMLLVECGLQIYEFPYALSFDVGSLTITPLRDFKTYRELPGTLLELR